MGSSSVPLRVSVLFFHPFPRRSQANRSLWQALEGLEGVNRRDLYSIYPSFSIDVEEEQRLLLETDVIVFQHPLYWYSCPALMKEWLDSVLERGWAYGEGGDKLKGKVWLQAITTGGGEETYHRTGYNQFSLSELLRPFEATARLCGMTFLPPFFLNGTGRLTDTDRKLSGDRYRELLNGLVHGRLPMCMDTTLCPEIGPMTRDTANAREKK